MAPHIERCYLMLLQVQDMLENAGQADVAAFLHHPIGLIEHRFDLASAEALETIRAQPLPPAGEG